MKAETISRLKKQTKWYDIIQSSGSSTPISFKNGRLYSVKEKQNSGTGVRVNCKGLTGFAYTNGPDPDKAVSAALTLAKYGENEDFDLPAPGGVYPALKEFAEGRFDAGAEIEKAAELSARITQRYPAAEVEIGISGGNSFRSLTNSQGLRLEEKSCWYSASASVTLADENGRLEVWSRFSSDEARPLDLLEREMLWRLDNSVRQVSTASKKMPVLLSPQALTSFLEILLSGLNARSVYRGISPYCGKIGSQMFNPALNIIDNPLLQESPFRFAFDDEGVAARTKHLVKDGIPETVINDLKYAWLLKQQPSGNGSRGYSSLPLPSLSCIEIVPGQRSFNELIGAIDEGIVVDSLIGLGQSNTVTGDFSGNIDMGFLVSKGELCGRVKDCMISGNLFELFAGSIEIASDPFFAGSSRVPGILLEGVDVTSQGRP